MKIRMITDYSELPDDPKAGDVLYVSDFIYDEDGSLEFYVVEGKDEFLFVYPYECEEVE